MTDDLATVTAIQALRVAIRQVFVDLSAGEMEQQWQRSRLILGVPELRMRMLDQFAGIIEVIAELVAAQL